MSNSPNTVATMAGLLKPTFSTTLPKLFSETSLLQKRFGWSDEALVGDKYRIPLTVKLPWGFTPGGAAGAVVTYEDARNGVTVNSEVDSYAGFLIEQASATVLDRAAKAGPAAFKAAAAQIGQNMAIQQRNINEMQILHGQTGLMTVGAAVAGQVITVSDETWSDGLASVLEGAVIDVFSDLVGTVRQAALVVSAVDLDAKTLTVTGTTTGITTSDVIFLQKCQTATTGVMMEPVGIYKQISAQTGTVFGVNKATYSSYRGRVSATTGTLTAGKLLTLASKIVSRGFQGKLIALMSPKAHATLNAANMAARMFDSSYSVTKASNGSEDLTFKGKGVEIECLVHPYAHDGRILMFPAAEGYVKRGGAVDLSFQIPSSDLEYILPIATTSAVQFQCRSDFFFVLTQVNWTGVMTGITY